MESLGSLKSKSVSLRESIYKRRFEVERDYMLSLKNHNLLQNFYFEAGLKTWYEKPKDIHWGWESPECQLRGHFLGHWLSAAATIYAQTCDMEIKSKADFIVNELARCQKENGEGWAGSIPEKYLYWIAKGKRIWAPHYTIHKTFMGLVDMYKYAGNNKALEIADTWADWFVKWTKDFSREQMENILDFETGGMLEIWADLYEITKKEKYLTLIDKYYRRKLFDRLIDGEDCLTGKHANTTIPEIIGAARLWEILGEEKYRKIVDNYWVQAVDERGYFCTGGQTNGEAWTPKGVLGEKLGDSNQEHCTVYNMTRLADFLFRWTGDKKYADYIERNIYNGLFAQQNINNGMVIYYLELQPNAKKHWGTPEGDFWCCFGTVVQAPSLYSNLAFYESEDGILLSQYIPSQIVYEKEGKKVNIEQYFEDNKPSFLIPNTNNINIDIDAEEKTEFTLTIRIPWWAESVAVKVNGEDINLKKIIKGGYIQLCREWTRDKIVVTLTKRLYTSNLPDMPYLHAFMYGPAVLAGLNAGDRTLFKSGGAVDLLRPIDVNKWQDASYYTRGQVENIKFIPLCDVIDDNYTVYFEIDDK